MRRAINFKHVSAGTWRLGTRQLDDWARVAATRGFMWGGQDDRESAAAVYAALDHGVNWIDTAPIYGSGHSEMMVGRAIREQAGRVWAVAGRLERDLEGLR